MTAGNAVSYVVSALISLAVLRRRIGRLEPRLGRHRAARRFSLAAAVAAALGLLVVRVLPGGSEPDRPAALLQLVVGGAVIMVELPRSPRAAAGTRGQSGGRDGPPQTRPLTVWTSCG